MPGSMGAVACGHPETAAAAQEILADGGNAYDAVIAAFCAAAVAEPVLCSLAGGGFLLAVPAEGRPQVYDFFVDTPLTDPGPLVRSGEMDFYPAIADFGTATQEFHIGLGAAATPGAVAGIAAVHEDLARMPLARLIAPAARLAREGATLRAVDAYLFSVVGPILTARADSRAVYTRADGALLGEGDRIVQPDLAGTLEALAAEGPRLFYEGEIGQGLVKACREQGGLLTAGDLTGYRVERRQPLERRYRGARIFTNPPPSTGGILIAFALALLDRHDLEARQFGSEPHLSLLTRVMALTNRARLESGMPADSGGEDQAAARLLDRRLLERYEREVSGGIPSSRGTTHISVVDGDGNIASLTLSNGEGCGYVLPGTGVMVNNMLGEADLNPGGFHRWPTGRRLCSMMSPSVARFADGGVAALGSGGSNRIRTAILQVLSNLIDFAMPVEEAVRAPRIHFEDGELSLEAELDEDLAALISAACAQQVTRTRNWPRHNLFFGGVHAVSRGADGGWQATGDPRRGGAALLM